MTVPQPAQGPLINPDPLRMAAEEPGASPGVRKLASGLVTTVNSQQQEKQPESLTEDVISSPEHFQFIFSVHISMLGRPLVCILLTALLHNLNLFIVLVF